jgi:hypothetical protein
MDFRFEPIRTWPGNLTKFRRQSPFRCGYDQTKQLLSREIEELNGKNVIIRMAVSDRDIRRDGHVSLNARPIHPGVILSLDSKVGPLNFPCDTFDDWQDNLRAIALALEALRKVDRYGVTRQAEQYKGWAQLPPPGGMPPGSGPFSIDEAARIVGRFSEERPEDLLISPGVFSAAYRVAAMKYHPDRNDGRELPEWQELQKAAEVLRNHHSTIQ